LGLTAVAFVAGFVSSIAGAGGMIVLPFLLWAGVPPLNALATNKFQSVFGTLSSTVNFLRRGQLQIKPLLPAIVCAFVGACAGTVAVQFLALSVLEAALPYLLLLVALFFALSPRISDTDSEPLMSAPVFNGAVGGGIGFYGGFFGPGMGSFYAIAFAALRGFGMRKATAATKPLVLVTNTTAMLIFLWEGYIVWELALVMALAQALGARIGSGLVMRKGLVLVKPLLIICTVAIATKLLLS